MGVTSGSAIPRRSATVFRYSSRVSCRRIRGLGDSAQLAAVSRSPALPGLDPPLAPVPVPVLLGAPVPDDPVEGPVPEDAPPPMVCASPIWPVQPTDRRTTAKVADGMHLVGGTASRRP